MSEHKITAQPYIPTTHSASAAQAADETDGTDDADPVDTIMDEAVKVLDAANNTMEVDGKTAGEIGDLIDDMDNLKAALSPYNAAKSTGDAGAGSDVPSGSGVPTGIGLAYAKLNQDYQNLINDKDPANADVIAQLKATISQSDIASIIDGTSGNPNISISSAAIIALFPADAIAEYDNKTSNTNTADGILAKYGIKPGDSGYVSTDVSARYGMDQYFASIQAATEKGISGDDLTNLKNSLYQVYASDTYLNTSPASKPPLPDGQTALNDAMQAKLVLYSYGNYTGVDMSAAASCPITLDDYRTLLNNINDLKNPDPAALKAVKDLYGASMVATQPNILSGMDYATAKTTFENLAADYQMTYDQVKNSDDRYKDNIVDDLNAMGSASPITVAMIKKLQTDTSSDAGQAEKDAMNALLNDVTAAKLNGGGASYMWNINSTLTNTTINNAAVQSLMVNLQSVTDKSNTGLDKITTDVSTRSNMINYIFQLMSAILAAYANTNNIVTKNTSA